MFACQTLESAFPVPLVQKLCCSPWQFACKGMVECFISWAFLKHMPLLSLFQTLNPPFPEEQEILPRHLKCSLFCTMSFVCLTSTEKTQWLAGNSACFTGEEVNQQSGAKPGPKVVGEDTESIKFYQHFISTIS